MADRADVIRRIKQLIVRALELQVEPEEIPFEETIFGGGLGADSNAALEVVFAVEEEFGIEVDDADLRVELFDSVQSLVEYVERALDQDEASPNPPVAGIDRT